MYADIVALTLKPHRTALAAGTADAQKLFLMLKMLPNRELVKARRPLSMVLVIDTSGSMREFSDNEAAIRMASTRRPTGDTSFADGKSYTSYDLPLPTKIDQAIEAAHRVVNDSRLQPGDRIAVVHFDTSAAVLAPLTNISSKSLIHAAIDRLRDHSGQTYMAAGLELAKNLLEDVPSDQAKRVIVLTDGATEREGACKKLAGSLAESNTPIVTIGIGTEYNEALLVELANVSCGRPFHLQRMEELANHLENELGTSTNEVLTDSSLRIRGVKNLVVDGVMKVYPNLQDLAPADGQYRLGNIAAGDFTVFIIEATISGLARPASRVRLAQLELAGFVAGQSERYTLPVQDMFVTFSTDSAAVASVDPEVMTYVQQKNIDRMINQAVGQATRNVGEARRTIQVAIGMTKRLNNPAMTKVLENALGELQRDGTISDGTRKTVVLGGKTKTIKAGAGPADEGLPSEDEIRRLSGL